MSNVKISQLPSATTPLGGTEVLPIVQSGVTKKVTVANLRGTAVTAVTGTAPVVSSGGTTPAISMPAATGSVNGYLTSADWTTFNNKGSGSVTGVTATSPVVSSGGAAPVISMPAATSSVNGYLTSADWATFNAKQPAGSYLVNGGALGTPSSGTATNLTGLPLTTGVTGILPVANGGNGTATPSLVAGTNVTISGSWPNQTINSTGGGGSGTVTSVATGTGLTGGPITTSGTIALANTAVTAGAYTAANITVDAQGRITAAANGSGGGGGTVTSVAATVPSFLSITGSPITTAGTLAITYSGTALPIANGGTGQTTAAAAITALTGSQTAGRYLRSDGTNAALAAIQAADVPTLNQNTTGTAANITASSNSTLTTLSALSLPGSQVTGNISGNAANVTGIVAVANGGTGTATPSLVAGTNITISGSFPNQTINSSGGGMVYPGAGIPLSTGSAWGTSYSTTGTGNVVLSTSPTLVTPALGTPASGVVTNLTGTASININGTVGATTANTGAFTTLSATGVTTVQAGSAAAPAITTSGDTNTGIFFPAADTIAFSEGGAEVARFDASGNLGIGTSSPTAKLDVNGITQSRGNIYGGAGNANANIIASSNVANGGAGSSQFLFGNTSSETRGYLSYNHANDNLLIGTTGTTKATIDSSGGFILAGSTAQKATGTTWSNPSDFRLKDNIRDYVKGAAELMQVRVREWEYNGKGGTVAGTKGLGVVADEAMLVLPDTVSDYEAKLNADDEAVTNIKKFDATEITWLLVKTVQEQQALITALTARLAALESN